MKKLLIACICAMGIAYAHHSMEGFDRAKNVTLVGTVKQFKWANPHSWIELEVPNDKGRLRYLEHRDDRALCAGQGRLEIDIVETRRQGHHRRPSAEDRRAWRAFVSVTTADGQTLTDRPPAAAPAAK